MEPALRGEPGHLPRCGLSLLPPPPPPPPSSGAYLRSSSQPGSCHVLQLLTAHSTARLKQQPPFPLYFPTLSTPPGATGLLLMSLHPSLTGQRGRRGTSPHPTTFLLVSLFRNSCLSLWLQNNIPRLPSPCKAHWFCALRSVTCIGGMALPESVVLPFSRRTEGHCSPH